MTWMRQEALSAPEKVAQQLKKNAANYQILAKAIRQQPPSFVSTIARGSSDHAATYAKYLFETYCQWPTLSIAPSVFTAYQTQWSEYAGLVWGISQSGASTDLVHSMQQLNHDQTIGVALVNQAGAPLSQASDFTIDMAAGVENAVAATKSYICTLSAIAHFVAVYTQDKSLLEALEHLPEALATATKQDWHQMVECFQKARGGYMIGRGYGYPVAQEAALKMKEVAGVQAEPFSSAEVQHGPFELLSNDFPVCLFAQQDATLNGVQTMMDKMTALKTPVFVALPKGKGQVNGGIELPVGPSLHPVLDPILNIQAFYMAAEQIAAAKGLDPDQPKHLQKVTKTV